VTVRLIEAPIVASPHFDVGIKGGLPVKEIRYQYQS
jgi:hypothetical protein